MTHKIDFLLASASPRRAELLDQIGARYRVAPVTVDEAPLPGEGSAVYVARLARAKARAALANDPGLPVLAADTTVCVDGQPMGKPTDEQECVAMLMALSGREHSVYTSVAMAQDGRLAARLSHTRVRFRPLGERECRAYWRTGEPADKAGGYGIQGLGAVFVEAIHGSYSGVVGLPLAETWELLQLFDIPCWRER